MEIDIHGIGSSGDGVGRLPDGRVVFVQGALPGDRVHVELTSQRKQVQQARLQTVVEPSPDRIHARCLVEACGGCALREYSGNGQQEIKRSRILDNLRKIAGIKEEIHLTVRQHTNAWQYRHRVRLHAAWLGQSWRIGFFERRSNQIVPFTSCPVLWPELEKTVTALAKALHELPREAGIQEIELAYSRRDRRAAARIYADGLVTAFKTNLDWIEDSKLSGVEVVTQTARWTYGNTELCYDHAHQDEFELRFEAGAFTQAYPEVNDFLVHSVFEAVRPRGAPRVLELHAGIGNFTIPLARAGARVTAYEIDRRASILCQKNARGAGVEVETVAKPDEAALNRLSEFDVLLIDPPRSGAKMVARQVAAEPRAPGRIVYVSCDSATLARDVAALMQGGYQLTALEAFDMFPQTPHVEALAVLERMPTRS